MGELKRPMGTPCFDEKGALEASQDVPRHDIQNPKECNRIPSSSKNNNGEFMFDNTYIYPIGSMYGIFTYICHKSTKCR